MGSSTFGKLFQITTWGESHGKGIGVIVDNCPAGIYLTEEMIQQYLDRRKPGQTKYSTPRKESDKVQILSGVFENRTTGTPISLMIANETQRSGDYSEIAQYYRPGHADFTFDSKYGFRDYRGGGRSSGRETIGRVAGGAIALIALKELGIDILAYTQSIGPLSISSTTTITREQMEASPLYMPDPEVSLKAEEYLSLAMKNEDSVGGIIECMIHGVPAGIGDPVFDKLDACLAKAIMSIGAIKGFEIGDGFQVAKNMGSENNDPFTVKNEEIQKYSNHAGGILGGISDGSDIVFRAAVKPTPSIHKQQLTVNKQLEEIKVQIKGRHDPIIVPRAVVVVEAMAAITLFDLLLSNMSSRMDRIKTFYQKETK